MVAWKTHLEAYETSQPGIKTYTISTDNYTLLLSETVIAVFEQTSPWQRDFQAGSVKLKRCDDTSPALWDSGAAAVFVRRRTEH